MLGGTRLNSIPGYFFMRPSSRESKKFSILRVSHRSNSFSSFPHPWFADHMSRLILGEYVGSELLVYTYGKGRRQD